MKTYYLINANGRYFGAKVATNPPTIKHTEVVPPQEILDMYAVNAPYTKSASWNGVGWDIIDDAPMAGYTPPAATYRTRLKPGEVMALLGGTAYTKVFRAAYPQGNKLEDDMALNFIEQAKYPYSEDGLIEVTDEEVTSALAYFRDKVPPYCTQEDVDRVLRGVPA